MDSSVESGHGRVVLVTDGEQRASLAVVRSLGAIGYTVIVTSSRRRSLAGASRFASSHFRLPSPLRDAAGFLNELEALVRASAVDVLVPMTEESLLPVLGARERFQDVIIPFASVDQFKTISNKSILLETAGHVGISVPDQRTLVSPSDVATLDERSIRFPVVLKPARSVVDVNGKATKLGVAHAADWAELTSVLRQYSGAAYPILLQRRIVGPGIGVFLLIWNGELVAVCGHRRIREAPPSGGVSVYREAVMPDASLVEKSRTLLEQFEWQGVAMVEYKIEETTQIPYLMEVNGRFWGSLQLAIDAGVDFPALLIARASAGTPATSVSTPTRVGVRSRWEWGDVNHLIARLRRSAEQLSLPPGSPGRTNVIYEFLRWRRTDRLEVFRWSDPAPFVRETVDWLRRQ